MCIADTAVEQGLDARTILLREQLKHRVAQRARQQLRTGIEIAQEPALCQLIDQRQHHESEGPQHEGKRENET